MNNTFLNQFNQDDEESVLSAEGYASVLISMEDHAYKVNEDTLDATRTVELYDSIEHLDSVLKETGPLTEQGARIAEIVGDVAVVGTNITGDAIVPSMESYIGQSISLEAFDYKNKWKKIRDVIVETIKKIIQRISDFLDQGDLVVAHHHRNIKKTELLVREARNMITKQERFEADTMVLDQYLNNGTEGINNAFDILHLFKVNESIYTSFYENYTNTLDEMLKEVIKIIKSNTTKSPFEVAHLLYQYLDNNFATLFNLVSRNLSSQTNFNSSNLKLKTNQTLIMKSRVFDSQMLGGLRIKINSPDRVTLKDRPIDFLNTITKSGVDVLSPEQIKPSRTLTEVWRPEEMADILDIAYRSINEIKYQRDRGGVKIIKTRLDELRREIDKYAVTAQVITGDDNRALNAINTLDLTFTNWLRSPLMKFNSYSLSCAGALNRLVRLNLAHYQERPKKDQKTP